MKKNKIFILIFGLSLVIIFLLFFFQKNIELIKFDINISKLEKKINEKYDKNYNIDGTSIVFISISNTEEKAVIRKGIGKNLSKAIDEAEKNIKDYIKENDYKVKWIKLDVVNMIKDEEIWNLDTYIDEVYKYHFYYGISLDDNFETCFIESEINSNQIINYKKRCIDIEKISDIANKELKELPEQIKMFKTSGYIYDGEVYELYDDWSNYGRRITNNEISKDDIKKLIRFGTEYLNKQVLENGKFIYGYNSGNIEELDSYNNIRHAGTIWSMINAYKIDPTNETKEKISKGITYLIENAVKYESENVAYLIEKSEDNIKLGGNALSLLMLIDYIETFGEEEYKSLAMKLGNGILELQEEDGSFTHVLNYPEYTVKDKFLTVYYDGEAIFALCKLYGLSNEEKYIQSAQKAIDYCMGKDYTKYRDHWISYSLNEFTKYNKDVKYYNFAMENISKSIGKITVNIYTSPVSLELLVAGFETYNRALINNIQIQKYFEENELIDAIKYRIDYQLNGYFYPEYAMYFSNPNKILNSFFVRSDNFRVRIDDVQHNIGGYYLAYNNYELLYK